MLSIIKGNSSNNKANVGFNSLFCSYSYCQYWASCRSGNPSSLAAWFLFVLQFILVNFWKHRVTIPCKWSFVVKSSTFHTLFMCFSFVFHVLLLGFIGVFSLDKPKIWAFAWSPSIGLSKDQTGRAEHVAVLQTPIRKFRMKILNDTLYFQIRILHSV